MRLAHACSTSRVLKSPLYQTPFLKDTVCNEARQITSAPVGACCLTRHDVSHANHRRISGRWRALHICSLHTHRPEARLTVTQSTGTRQRISLFVTADKTAWCTSVSCKPALRSSASCSSPVLTSQDSCNQHGARPVQPAAAARYQLFGSPPTGTRWRRRSLHECGRQLLSRLPDGPHRRLKT